MGLDGFISGSLCNLISNDKAFSDTLWHKSKKNKEEESSRHCLADEKEGIRGLILQNVVNKWYLLLSSTE